MKAFNVQSYLSRVEDVADRRAVCTVMGYAMATDEDGSCFRYTGNTRSNSHQCCQLPVNLEAQKSSLNASYARYALRRCSLRVSMMGHAEWVWYNFSSSRSAMGGAGCETCACLPAPVLRRVVDLFIAVVLIPLF